MTAPRPAPLISQIPVKPTETAVERVRTTSSTTTITVTEPLADLIYPSAGCLLLILVVRWILRP
jgi:hypothetical protein